MQRKVQNLNEEEKEEIDDDVEAFIQKRDNQLTRFLRKQKKRLILNQFGIDDVDSFTLFNWLVELREQYECIDLSNNQLTDEGFLNILMGLQMHFYLKELYISKNIGITGLGVEALFESINVLPNLQTLFLNSCQIDDGTLIKMCMKLSSIENLKHLSLNNNNIEEEGLLCLSMLFQSENLNQLEILELGNNPLKKLGLKSLIESLNFNKTLKSLNLNRVIELGNDISEGTLNECMKCMGKLIQYNEGLESLNISNCGITDLGFEYLVKGLQKNLSLSHLQLFKNRLTSKTIKQIKQLVNSNKFYVKYITLFGNDIKDEMELDELMQDINLNYYSELQSNNFNNANILKSLNTYQEMQDEGLEPDEYDSDYDEEIKENEIKQDIIKQKQIQQQQLEQEQFESNDQNIIKEEENEDEDDQLQQENDQELEYFQYQDRKNKMLNDINISSDEDENQNSDEEEDELDRLQEIYEKNVKDSIQKLKLQEQEEQKNKLKDVKSKVNTNINTNKRPSSAVQKSKSGAIIERPVTATQRKQNVQRKPLTKVGDQNTKNNKEDRPPMQNKVLNNTQININNKPKPKLYKWQEFEQKDGQLKGKYSGK